MADTTQQITNLRRELAKLEQSIPPEQLAALKRASEHGEAECAAKTQAQQTTDLCERLRASEHRGRYAIGGGCIDANGNGKSRGGEKIMEPRNPDGPEAAATIEQLQSRISECEEVFDIPENWELSWGELDGDLSEASWRVHQRNGGINDREWTLIAVAETPFAALTAARATLTRKVNHEQAE